mmetsp:Transcript_7164/g.22953  ORF Transcript_7164/g.22953 Transcript_7164/m.22953 type:complete len:210 (+) Transcript_7164:149-778(+)
MGSVRGGAAVARPVPLRGVVGRCGRGIPGDHFHYHEPPSAPVCLVEQEGRALHGHARLGPPLRGAAGTRRCGPPPRQVRRGPRGGSLRRRCGRRGGRTALRHGARRHLRPHGRGALDLAAGRAGAPRRAARPGGAGSLDAGLGSLAQAGPGPWGTRAPVLAPRRPRRALRGRGLGEGPLRARCSAPGRVRRAPGRSPEDGIRGPSREGA